MERRSIWPLWAGFALSVVAVFSFLAFFVQFASTRNFPWATLILLAIALVLAVVGLRRAFQGNLSRGRKIGSSIGAVLTALVAALFVFGFFVGAKLPVSKGAPQIGQKAPGFNLSDSNGKTVSLNELLTMPVAGKTPRGVLLVFYRGYW